LDILAHFNSTNDTIGTLATTIFLLGYTFGPILIAPLSELYGRAILYKMCMVFFVVFNVACAVSDSLGSLVAYRFLAGIMGSCPVTLGTGSIADMVATEKRAGAMGAYIIGAVLGPAIGPVIGGYLAPSVGWRWTFWLMAIASGVMSTIAILFVRESYPYAILERKTRRLQKKTGNMHLRSSLHTGKTPGSLFAFSIARPLKMLMSPIVFSLSLYAATVYAYLYLCFTTFDIVFYGQYNFNSSEAGLAALGVGVGSVFGCIICGVAANAVSKSLTEKHGGDPKPEYRLPPMILGGLCTPIGLFWYGWSAHAKVHWIVPILGTVFIGMGMVFTYVRTLSLKYQRADDHFTKIK
jgi:multidrug resistance protein